VSEGRRRLNFNSEDDVIADVQRLRRGYARSGAWSLPQMCAHLEAATRYRMQPGPFPPNTPEQNTRRAMFAQIMASGQLPDGSVAAPTMMPPEDGGYEKIDAFIAAITEFKSFPGPIAPHRIFGHLSDSDARRLNLIHCAHHLSYLTPTTS